MKYFHEKRTIPHYAFINANFDVSACNQFNEYLN